MLNQIVNLLVGAAGSILATIILFICSTCYKIGYKGYFILQFERAKTAVWQIENQHTFEEDYELVIGQIDILYDCVLQMYNLLYPLSLWWRSTDKKLIITMLYDILHKCERSKLMTKGIEGYERQVRLEEIHKCFYKCTFVEESNKSTVSYQLNMIEALLNKRGLAKVIESKLQMEAEQSQFWIKLEEDYIDVNSFRIKDEAYKRYMRNKGIIQEKYIKIVRNAKVKYNRMNIDVR